MKKAGKTLLYPRRKSRWNDLYGFTYTAYGGLYDPDYSFTFH